MFSVAAPAGRCIGGTPTTMAPEGWNGHFGPKCDVWSLGCIMSLVVEEKYVFAWNLSSITRCKLLTQTYKPFHVTFRTTNAFVVLACLKIVLVASDACDSFEDSKV